MKHYDTIKMILDIIVIILLIILFVKEFIGG